MAAIPHSLGLEPDRRKSSDQSPQTPRRPSVVSEATAKEKIGEPHQNLRRSLLIQRLEGSRPAVRSGAMAMGFR
jgi:hypothetical protein